MNNIWNYRFGTQVLKKIIPYGKQSISEQDIDAVVNVLKSDFITQGPVVPEFEQAVAGYCGANYAVAVCNATSALHLACRALNIGYGDRVWTSPNTFVASANCVLYCGATIDFVDIDPQTYNLSIEQLQKKLEWAERNNQLPKAIICVHFAGQSCAMKKINELSKKYHFYIIEDAAHAIGASHLNKKVGSCTSSDITIFSFHPVKIITTGEGGMLLTNKSELADKIKRLRSHGITRDPIEMENISHGEWYYEQIELGFNYRMTDIQAALGLSQLERLDDFIEKRRALVQRYNEQLSDLPVTLPWQSEQSQSSWHLYVICLELDKINKSRKQIFSELRQQGIGVNVHYIPVHTQPYYQNLGFKWGDFPISENYYNKAITLPLFPEMAESDIDYIKNKLAQIIH